MAKIKRKLRDEAAEDVALRGDQPVRPIFQSGVAPDQKEKGGIEGEDRVRRFSPKNAPTKESSEKWQRKFDELAKQNKERLAAAQSSSRKRKFNAEAFRHRPI